MDNKFGDITINKKYFKYILFDINQLIILIKTKEKLIKSLEESIRALRKEEHFNIYKLIEENIKIHPYETLYFIIYKSNEIIATSRIIFKQKSKSCYINMVFTNEKYRGNKICQFNINKLIELTKHLFNSYKLEVYNNNIPAIKCYENVGFKFVKEIIINKYNIQNQMKYICK